MSSQLGFCAGLHPHNPRKIGASIEILARHTMFCSLIHIEGESNDQQRRLPRSTAVWTSNLVRMMRSVLNDPECGPLSRMGPPEYDRNCIDHQRAFPVSPNIVLLWTDAFSHSGQRCHSGMNNRYTEGNIFVVAAQEIGEKQNFCKGGEPNRAYIMNKE